MLFVPLESGADSVSAQVEWRGLDVVTSHVDDLTAKAQLLFRSVALISLISCFVDAKMQGNVPL